MPYFVTPVSGLSQRAKRAVAFLSGDSERLDAMTVFEDLLHAKSEAQRKRKLNARRMLLTRFDYWVSGETHNDKWFHGWSSPEFAHCFVFKWKLNNVDQRFYGFLCKPQPRYRPWFQLCVLHTHDTKTAWETESAHLKLANALRIEEAVLGAIRMHFSDTPSGEPTCKN